MAIILVLILVHLFMLNEQTLEQFGAFVQALDSFINQLYVN